MTAGQIYIFVLDQIIDQWKTLIIMYILLLLSTFNEVTYRFKEFIDI